MAQLKRVVCVGGGPAGLYFATLVKRSFPRADVTVYEREPRQSESGWGVMFSDRTLQNLREADARSFAAIESGFVHWNGIQVRRDADVCRTSGHPFVAIDRNQMLRTLAAQAEDAGVTLRFGETVSAAERFDDVDVVAVCDGARSAVREHRAAAYRPQSDISEQRYFWVGSDQVFDEFAYIFVTTEHGVFQAQAYPHAKDRSTLSFVISRETLERAGLLGRTEQECARYLENVMRDHLGGHRLLTRGAVFGRFRTVRCERWIDGRVALLGDAAHTAHFTVGSGTKMALEDAMALRDALVAHAEVPAALLAFEELRRPVVERTQAFAAASCAFAYYPERYAKLTPEQFAFRLITRTGRFTRANAAKRDPEYVAAAARAFAGGRDEAPAEVPLDAGGRTLPARHLSVRKCGEARAVLERRGWSADVLLSPSGHALPASDGASLRALWIDREAQRAGGDALVARLLANDADLVVVESTAPGLDGAMVAERLRLALARPVAIAYPEPVDADLVDTLLLGGRVDLVLDPSTR